jgi:predicted GNAT family acetyltransferase
VASEEGASDITVADVPERHRYEARLGGELAGLITYRPRTGGIEMVHTEVRRRFEGHGVGSVLVRQALDDVAARGLTVVPTCPFVAGYIAEHPEYRSLVAQN